MGTLKDLEKKVKAEHAQLASDAAIADNIIVIFINTNEAWRDEAKVRSLCLSNCKTYAIGVYKG